MTLNPLNVVLFVVVLLLAVGFYGLLITRNLIKIVLVLQVLVKAVVIALVLAGKASGNLGLGQSIAATVIVADTVVAVVALALAVQVRRRTGTLDLAKISTNIESGKGTIGRLMMDPTWRENIQSTIINLKDGSEKFVVFMDKSQQIDNILLALNSNIDSTSAVIQDLSKITSNIESGEGVVGKLLMDQSMGQNLDSTLINLKKGLAEFEIFMKMAQESWLLSF